MNDPAEQTLSSSLPTPWLAGVHAHGYRWEPWQLAMVESWQQVTTEPRLEPPTVPIPRVSHVSVRCTLKLTSLLTLQDMELLWRDARYMLQTVPAIRALVSSLMREYQPWFSIVSIEIKQASDC